MEFKQTGLPLEPSVYKAFMLYSQNVKNMPARYQEDYPIRVAKVLHETVGNDPTLLAASLLTVMPPTTYGIIEQRFGQGVVDILTEANKQTKTEHQHLIHASERVKLLCMASAITSFDDFRKLSAKMDRQIAQGQEEGHLDEPLFIVRMPNTAIYDHILAAVTGKTAIPALEDLYAEKLADFKIFNKEHNAKLQELGIDDDAFPGGPSMKDFRFPTFEETDLIDDPMVREAYYIITTHERVLPENFEGALDVARLLSNSVAMPNPPAVAAALLDIAIMDMNTKDLENLKLRLVPEVLEVLMSGSVYDTKMGPDRIMKASLEFRQIALANSVVLIEGMLEAGQELVAMIEERKDQFPPDFLMRNLMPIGMVYLDIKTRILPIFGTTDLPELEGRLEEKMVELYDFLDEKVPRPQNAPKPKDGPRGPKFG